MPRTPLPPSSVQRLVKHQRLQLLRRVQQVLEGPMVVLGLVWLVLLVIDLIKGLGSVLEFLNYAIWVIFILDFLLQFALAPEKLPFLQRNWLTVISLAVPALRIFRITRFLRIFRTVRAVRGLRLVRVLSSLNRGMKSLGATMGRRGFGYILTLTLVVLLAGAAGMFAFESGSADGLHSYPEALWWTAMLLISLGSEYWPKSPEGRALCFLLALYGFAVLGYFTAVLASFFLDQDAGSKNAEVAGAKQMVALHREIKALRKELQEVLAQQSAGKENAQMASGATPPQKEPEG